MPGQNPDEARRRRHPGHMTGPEEMAIPAVPAGPGPGWVPPSTAMHELAERELAGQRVSEAAQILAEADAVRGTKRDPRCVADPSLSELFQLAGMPAQYHRAAARAVGDWLMTWKGNLANAVAKTPAGQHALDVIQDETINQLADRARGGR